MSVILGLINAESFEANRFKNVRRSVFYFYPQGAAPLTGLISLLSEESTNDPEYKWFEKRLPEQRTTTAAISTTIAFYKLVNAAFTTWTIADGDITFTKDTVIYGIKVIADGTDQFRVGHVLRFLADPATGSDKVEVLGRILNVDRANERMAFVVTETQTILVDYDDAANVGMELLIVGSSHAEGATGETPGAYQVPVEPKNFTSISRTTFSETGTALKTSARYDKTGLYNDLAKEHSVYHMIELEKKFIFSRRNIYNVSGTIVRDTGGILWTMGEWEAGSTYGNTAATVDTDDNKRIITNSDGNMTIKKYNEYLERLFRVTNNKSNEKLVLCGGMFLSQINQMYVGQSVLSSEMPATFTFGMDVVKHRSPFGTIYYKTHPLFTQNAVLRNNALFLDVHNLVYRYLEGRDTELLENRQANNADFREDEWLTEAGLEVRFPEAFMYIQNVTSWS